VPGLAGGHIYARILAAPDKAVREVIALAADPPDEAMGDLTTTWDYHTGDDAVDEQTARIRQLCAEADRLRARASDSRSPISRHAG